MLKSLGNKILLSIGIGALVFIGMSVYADFSRLLISFRAFAWGYLPAVLGLALLNYLLRFLKWDRYLSILNIRLARKDSLSVFLAGLVMSVTPGKSGELLKSYLVKQLKGTPISVSAPVMLAERFTDFMALLILSVFGIFSFRLGVLPVVISFGMLLGVILVISHRGISHTLIRGIERLPVLSRFSERVSRAYESIRTLLTWDNLIWATAISVAAWFAECLGFYLILKGFGVSLSVLQATFIYSLATIFGAVSMMPGGLGTTEGSMAGLLMLESVSGPIAVASTFVIRVCTLWFAVIIGAVALLMSRKRYSFTGERNDEGPTTKGQRRTANKERRTANKERRIQTPSSRTEPCASAHSGRGGDRGGHQRS